MSNLSDSELLEKLHRTWVQALIYHQPREVVQEFLSFLSKHKR